MEIIQLWTFWTFFWTFYLNHLSPLWGYFFLRFCTRKRSKTYKYMMLSLRALLYSANAKASGIFLCECIIEIARTHFSAISLLHCPQCKGILTLQPSINCGSFSHCCDKFTIPGTDASVHDRMMYVFFFF